MPLGTIHDYYKRITMTTLNFLFQVLTFCHYPQAYLLTFAYFQKLEQFCFAFQQNPLLGRFRQFSCYVFSDALWRSRFRKEKRLKTARFLSVVVRCQVIDTTTNISFSWQDLSLALDLLVEAAVRLPIS